MSSIAFLPTSAQDKSTSKNPASARFIVSNETDSSLNIYCVDFDGKEVLCSEVARCKLFAQYQTYSPHVWEVKDSTGAIRF